MTLERLFNLSKNRFSIVDSETNKHQKDKKKKKGIVRVIDETA